MYNLFVLRYNTYTINTDDTIQNGVSGDNSLTEVPTVNTECEELTLCNDEQLITCSEDNQKSQKKKIQRVTPKQRRLADKDRFRTRTLSVNCDTNNILSPTPSPDVEMEVNENVCIVNPSSYTVINPVNNFVSASSADSEGESQSQEDGNK